MIQTIRRKTSAYSAIGATIPKIYLAYQSWFWANLILNTITLTIFVFFWRAVYADTDTIAGLDLQQTLNYILLAQVFYPLTNTWLIFEFGFSLREGGIAHALLRPVDFQLSYYVQYLVRTATDLVLQIPIALVATLIFGLQWPSEPLIWLAFTISAFLGRSVLFFFDWMLACLTFYTTETWGLGVLVFGVELFLSGSLIPLVMLPDSTQMIASMTPFAQALYVPLSILSGIVPLENAPSLWLTQIAWLFALGLLSRLVFRTAIKKVTVQGG